MSNGAASRQDTLVDQQEAIRDYLDALLQEIPDFDDGARPQAKAASTVTPGPTEQVTASAVPEPPAPVVESEPEPEPESARVVEPETEPGPVAEDVSDTPATEAPGAPADDPSVPVADEATPSPRGEEAVQALFFTVGGLKLAVPLTELHSVVPWRDVDVTPMPRQPDWHMGLMRYRNRNVRVIDTVTMVLPPDKRQTEEALATPQHILVVGDGSWGLACHAIGDVVRLAPDEVKWRKRGSKRPWLAGTVIGHLSAVIDTGAFTHMLETQAPNR